MPWLWRLGRNFHSGVPIHQQIRPIPCTGTAYVSYPQQGQHAVKMPAMVSQPVHANFPSEKLTIGVGVAIFHLATERVVVCYHTRDKYWFLPKGRRNANEDTVRAAEREGFEESGYRNRALPLPMKHRQPDPDEGHQPYVVEPIWTQLIPLTATSQYLLFWYAAETIPAAIEESSGSSQRETSSVDRKCKYYPPQAFPPGSTLQQRIAADLATASNGSQTIYEPMHYQGTGADDEELLYKSHLLPINEARRRLKGTVMEDVVRRGFEGIQVRTRMESDEAS